MASTDDFISAPDSRLPEKNRSATTITLWVAVYAIAMGFLEGAVVVYLRELYYHEFFQFPLKMVSVSVAIVEIYREVATLIMLLSIGILAGRTASSRFAYFIFSFALWDIVYYFALWLFLGWPASLLEWDVLFLIPVTWTGPVITPVITSLVMILFALIIIRFNTKSNKVFIKRNEWLLLIIGSLVLITSYVWDFCRFILSKVSFSEFLKAYTNNTIIELSLDYVPESFNWFLYSVGTIIILGGIALFYYRNSKKNLVSFIR